MTERHIRAVDLHDTDLQMAWVRRLYRASFIADQAEYALSHGHVAGNWLSLEYGHERLSMKLDYGVLQGLRKVAATACFDIWNIKPEGPHHVHAFQRDFTPKSAPLDLKLVDDLGDLELGGPVD